MAFLVGFLIYALVLSEALRRGGVRALKSRELPEGPSGASERQGSAVRVLVIGATGGTGRELVSQALARGWVVTAFVRDPATFELAHANLKILKGNVLDRVSVEAAMRNQDAVLSALGHKRYFGPSQILSSGTDNLIQAMDRHGVRRFVCETSLGLGDSAFLMGLYYTFFVIPVVLPFYYWDKARQERFIAASNLDWTIVRPGALTRGPARHQYRHGARVGNPWWTVRISRADVADFMLNQLTDRSAVRSAVGVAW